MSEIQKVIKYCAMAFAIFLSVVILGSIVAVVVGVTSGVSGINIIAGEEKERIRLYEEFSLEEAQELGITSILVDCNAEITIKPGEVLSISAENVTDEYKIRQTNGRFSITQDTPNINIRLWFGDVSERETVVVTIPEGFSTNQVVVMSGSGRVHVTGTDTRELTVDSGSGKVTVEDVTADRLDVDSGSGRVSLSRATMSETRINSGSGGVTIEDAVLGRLALDSGSGTVRMERVEATEADVDTGSGAVSFEGKLTGTNEFETGSGSLTLRLDGKEEEYRVKAECGSGTFRINGKKKDDGSYGSNVMGELIIDSGSGAVNVEFLTPEE